MVRIGFCQMLYHTDDQGPYGIVFRLLFFHGLLYYGSIGLTGAPKDEARVATTMDQRSESSSTRMRFKV